MSASAAPQPRLPDARSWHRGAAPAPRHDAGLDFRQLRHLTKNAIQRLLCEVARSGEMQTDGSQRRWLADLERRLLLSARVSDALFGLTSHPAPLSQRLTALVEATVGLMADTDQSIRIEVDATGPVDPADAPILLRIAHEMVVNAVRHGLRDRMIGCLVVRLTADEYGTRLAVGDDGWGLCGAPDGAGTEMMQELARGIGGTVTLRRDQDRTWAAAVVRRSRVRIL